MAHQHQHEGSGNLKLAFFLNLGFTVFEFIGGFYVNSIAIISDALHDLGDSLSLGLSWYLDEKSKQGANTQFTFGYKRFSLLGALVNSLVLIAGSVFVIQAAIGRILEPEHSDAAGMVIFALFGVAMNGYASWRVSKGKTLNERVITWHLLEDVLGWASILVVSVILLFWDNHYLDPALSILITMYILWNVYKRLKETLFIFLQGKPADINLDEIKKRLESVDKVNSLHHTHIWSLEGEHNVFTTHVVLNEIDTFNDILEVKRRIKEILKEYEFSHFTVEVELNKETCSLR